jgi:hypothetical protein
MRRPHLNKARTCVSPASTLTRAGRASAHPLDYRQIAVKRKAIAKQAFRYTEYFSMDNACEFVCSNFGRRTPLTTAWVANQCEASALGLLRPRLDGIERMRLIGDDIAFRVEELLDRLRSSS